MFLMLIFYQSGNILIYTNNQHIMNTAEFFFKDLKNFHQKVSSKPCIIYGDNAIVNLNKKGE